MAVRVQIYTAQSVEEARALAAAGVDHVGVTPERRGLPGEIDVELAAEIRRALAGKVAVVALSVRTDISEIVDLADRVRPDILHLCPPGGSLTPHDVRAVKQAAGVPLMFAVGVIDDGAVEVARRFAPVSDYLLLDSAAPGAPIGATGVTHDWAVSRQVVEAVDVPVILAGGLSAANVADAVRMVRPWGVDSLSHTNRPVNGGFRKDLDLVRAFVEAAKGVDE